MAHGAAAEIGATAVRVGGLSAMAGYQAPQDGPGWPFRSRSCMTGTHQDCGHLGSVGYDVWGGGRPALTLCQCGCHSACPLAGRLPFVSRAIWVGLCDCPGAELAEGRLDDAERKKSEFPDFERRLRERREQRARERQEERAAREATRATGAGKSRAQIREIYVAELRARGLTVPSDLVLDATADAIARNREEFSAVYSVRVLAEQLRELRKPELAKARAAGVCPGHSGKEAG